MEAENWKKAAIKERIFEVAVELAKSKGLEDISVKTICAAAEISRPTFYRYFKDKYSIIQWHFLNLCKDGLYMIGRTLSWEEADLAVVCGIYEKRDLYIRAYQDNRHYQSITAFGHRVVREALVGTIENHKGLTLTPKIDFQISFYANGTMNSLTNWGRKGMQMPPEDFAAFLTSCVPRELYVLLEPPA